MSNNRKNIGSLIGKAASLASMGFAAFQVSKAHASQVAADAQIASTANAVDAFNAQATEHMNNVSSMVDTLNTQAAEHITNVANTVELVDTQAIEHIANVSDVINAADASLDANTIAAMSEAASISDSTGEVASSVLESFLDWF
jgi:hypothetical protein